MTDLNPQPGDPWWLIFERDPPPEGATFVQGGFGGSIGHPNAHKHRNFKPVTILRAPDWKAALDDVLEQTGRVAEFAAVQCTVFLPDLITGTDDTVGTE